MAGLSTEQEAMVALFQRHVAAELAGVSVPALEGESE